MTDPGDERKRDRMDDVGPHNSRRRQLRIKQNQRRDADRSGANR